VATLILDFILQVKGEFPFRHGEKRSKILLATETRRTPEKNEAKSLLATETTEKTIQNPVSHGDTENTGEKRSKPKYG